MDDLGHLIFREVWCGNLKEVVVRLSIGEMASADSELVR
jgi:hypothetical protein